MRNIGISSTSTRGRRRSPRGYSSTLAESMRSTRFSQLSSVLDPDKPPRSDKVSILGDAARLLMQLKTKAE
ncbi:uncharacterized protein A4U43_C06F7000 [Asparagus officinalis]|uniref:BHLH domain-containing protein n=1 Tax=Asparagus officinalis TaxID=4686 RepID=A0A5P1EMG8_ASPOF|nr:uncharacterized protein A4U43_C06F7000 [Asparagus officinalis]